MNASDVLRGEHSLFARLLDGLELLTGTDRVCGNFEVELINGLIDFFARFVDGLHQDKEERVLFPRLVMRIGRLEVPEVERLADSHRRERRLLGQMRFQVWESGGERPGDVDLFATRARAYLRLQRRHIQEENTRLLPMTEQVLTPDDEAAVRAGFRRLEHEHGICFEPQARQLLGRMTEILGQLPPSEATLSVDQGRVFHA